MVIEHARQTYTTGAYLFIYLFIYLFLFIYFIFVAP